MSNTVRRATRARLAALGGIAALAVASLIGCSSTSPSTSGKSPGGTLTILVSSAEGSDKAYKALNAEFEKAFPKVKVQFSSVPNAAFAAARSSRMTAGSLDITIGAPFPVPKFAKGGTEGDDAIAADNGLFMDLSKQPFMKNFTPTVVDALKYKGKSYEVPMGLSYYTGVFYNKQIFDDNGIKIPTTWDQFKSAVSKLKKAGVTPLGIGGKDGWPAGLLMQAAVQSMFPTAADKTDLAAGIWDGSIKLTDPKQVEVLDKVKYLYGTADENFAGVPYTSVPGDFASGKVAMTIDGTWNQTTIDSAVNGSFDYGYFPLPSSDNAADNKNLGGKIEIRMVVPSNAPNKTAALAYLNFFSEKKNYAKFVVTCGFAPAEPGIASNPFLKSIAPYTSTFEPAWDGVWYINAKAGPAAILAFNYAGIAPLGTGTAEQAAQAAQTDWNAAG